jgi:uroporphyrinogen-III synthase
MPDHERATEGAGTSAVNAPLAGVRVVITRPGKQAAIFAQRLAIIGGEPIVLSAMVIAPPADDTQFAKALRHLAGYDFAFFVSANAGGSGAVAGLPVAGNPDRDRRGPTTADSLILGGIARVLVPAFAFDSEGVPRAAGLQDVEGKRFVVFRGEGSEGGTGRELMRRDACRARRSRRIGHLLPADAPDVQH